LRRYPREAGRPVGGVVASVDIAGRKVTKEIVPRDESAVFELPLPPGKHDFAGGFKDSSGKDIGAFFAHLRRLD